MASSQQSSRRCIACGRPIDWSAQLCPYCGHDYRQQARPAQPKKDTALWVVVIVLIVIIIVPVVIGAILYVTVFGFGGTSYSNDPTPNIQVLQRFRISNGFEIVFTSPTAKVVWGDVAFSLEDLSVKAKIQGWYPTTAALTSSTPPGYWHDVDSKQIRTLEGTLDVWLNATDLAGDGRMGNGDSITLQCAGSATFSPNLTYTLNLLYKPTGGLMMSASFSG
jgi:predicted nucleic acid-binding Zn ribbon protein